MSDGEPALRAIRPKHMSGFAALFAFVLLAATSFFVSQTHQPPAAVSADAPPEVFSAGRAAQKLEYLLGDETPHPLGTLANDRVRARLLSELEGLGLQIEKNDHWVPGANRWSTSVVRARNILAEIPSSNPDLPAIMLACHYDSVPAGPGASDDGAAVAALLEVARILVAEAPLPRPVLLLFTDGEELGLHGARAFSIFNEAADRVGMILNFEARGSSGGSLMFETSSNNEWMIRQVAAGLERPMSSSAYVEVYRMMPNSSDLTVFMKRNLAGINFAFIGNPKHYHTPLDNLANLDRRSLQHHGDNALGMVRQLLRADWSEAEEPEGDAVYTDLFARWIVAWPAAWGPWIAGALLVLLYIPYRRLRRPCRWRVPQLAGAATCWLLANIVGVTLGWLAAWCLLRIDQTPTMWPADMAFDIAVPCLGAGAGVLLILLLFRPDPALFFLVHGIAISIGGLILSIRLAGFSYLFTLPAAGAVLVSPLFLVRKPGTSALTLACLVVGFITAVLATPVLLRLPECLGVIFSPPAVAAVTVVLLLPLLPLLSTIRRRFVYQSALALTLAAGVCGYLAVQSPPFTPQAPQQITLTYLQEEDAEQAQLSVSTWEGKVPADLHQNLTPLAQPNPLYTPSADLVFQSPVAGLTAPAAELLAWNAEGVQHTAKIRFTRSGPSQQILAGIPVSRKLIGLKALGKELKVPAGEKDDCKWLRFRGVGDDGIEIELTWEGPGNLPLVLVGITPGLPAHLATLTTTRDELPACTAHMGDESIAIRKVTLESPVF